jgi:hypothetical protein
MSRIRTAQALGVVIGAAMLAACAASPTATPSLPPEATPAATPDIAEVFLARMADPDLPITAEVTGTMVVRTGGISIEMPITGDFHYSGGNSTSSLTVGAGELLTLVDQVELDGDVYSSTDGGPWILAAPPAETASGEDSLAASLAKVERLADGGTTSQFGRTVHRLVPSDPEAFAEATLALLGSGADPTMRDIQADLALFAEPDGTPAGFTLAASWVQDVTGSDPIDAEIEIAFEFTDLETPVTVSRPDAVWTSFAPTDAPFSVAYPEDWEMQVGFGTAYFSPPDGSGFFSISLSEPTADVTTQEAFAASWSATYASLGAVAASSEPYAVDDAQAVIVGYREAYDDVNSYVLSVPVLHGDLGYVFELATIAAPGEEGLVRELFDAFMSTFTFTD